MRCWATAHTALLVFSTYLYDIVWVSVYLLNYRNTGGSLTQCAGRPKLRFDFKHLSSSIAAVPLPDRQHNVNCAVGRA